LRGVDVRGDLKIDAMREFRERWENSACFTAAELEERIDYAFRRGAFTVYEQIRQLYLDLVEGRGRAVAEQMLQAAASFLDRRVESEQDVHDLCQLLALYSPGCSIRPDLPPQAIAELSGDYSLPLSTITVRADSPYQVWVDGSSQRAQWKAWREGQPTAVGYGMSEQEAVEDLRYAIKPDSDGSLDGLGTPSGALLGVGLQSRRATVQYNKKQFCS